jgi:hypothetical protein
MAEIVPLPQERRGRGRPKRQEPPVKYTLQFTRQQAAYLTYLARVRGWAPSANNVAKLIVDSELKRLDAARFHETDGALPTEIDDSADPEG